MTRLSLPCVSVPLCACTWWGVTKWRGNCATLAAGSLTNIDWPCGWLWLNSSHYSTPSFFTPNNRLLQPTPPNGFTNENIRQFDLGASRPLLDPEQIFWKFWFVIAPASLSLRRDIWWQRGEAPHATIIIDHVSHKEIIIILCCIAC